MELTFRGHEVQLLSDEYYPKPPKPWHSVTRPIHYLLREQRLVFLLLGIAISTLVFCFFPSSPPTLTNYNMHDSLVGESFLTAEPTRLLPHRVRGGFRSGKVTLGLKTKGLRIVVTGGAGFVGSHLVDRLIARGDSVIVVDNFFTGRKENVMHHFGNPRFELIRHDVVEPLLLEVDQIYHLACPASPVHYKHNPVKTIISFHL